MTDPGAGGEGLACTHSWCPTRIALQVPAVNASWMGEFIRQYKNVDVNVAVQTPVGLMVPFVRNTDTKGLAQISKEVKALAAKVCGRVVRPPCWD